MPTRSCLRKWCSRFGMEFQGGTGEEKCTGCWYPTRILGKVVQDGRAVLHVARRVSS